MQYFFFLIHIVCWIGRERGGTRWAVYIPLSIVVYSCYYNHCCRDVVLAFVFIFTLPFLSTGSVEVSLSFFCASIVRFNCRGKK